MSIKGVSFIARSKKVGGIVRSPHVRRLSASYQRLYGGLTTRKRGGGQFLQARQAEALQEQFRCREAQAAVCTGKFLYKLEISKRHDEPTLVGIEEMIDFCLADRLPKRDAGKDFERRGCELRTSVCLVLFA